MLNIISSNIIIKPTEMMKIMDISIGYCKLSATLPLGREITKIFQTTLQGCQIPQYFGKGCLDPDSYSELCNVH